MKLDLTDKLSKKNNYAIFLDKENNVQIAVVRIVQGSKINIDSFNSKGEHTAYMRIDFDKSNRFFLDRIYCFSDFRGLNIAKNLIIIADYFMQNYDNYIIRGDFSPYDLTEGIEYDEHQIRMFNERVENFYKSAGYTILKYDEYILDKKKYPELDESTDFCFDGEEPQCIVYKKVGKNLELPFSIINGTLVKDDAQDIFNSEKVQTLLKKHTTYNSRFKK